MILYNQIIFVSLNVNVIVVDHVGINVKGARRLLFVINRVNVLNVYVMGQMRVDVNQAQTKLNVLIVMQYVMNFIKSQLINHKNVIFI